MSLGVIATVFAAIIGVATLSVAVTSPNTAGIITSFGNAFTGALSAAKGK